jgi:hypothetical protein
VVEQRADAATRLRGDGKDLGVREQLGGRVQRLHGARVVEPVDLVQRDHDRHARAGQRLGDEAVARAADALVAVDHEQRRVGLPHL